MDVVSTFDNPEKINSQMDFFFWVFFFLVLSIESENCKVNNFQRREETEYIIFRMRKYEERQWRKGKIVDIF